ncbi:pilus (MSHA type) biogenesis protein MshL [Dechloromonas denitrificans]|uniref:pilus (MSHA type) biogenesis protein MshL n=1 Tax=Dechloromonas denitrificans TaxID=281362 RepID=UPI001CF8B173|nr:pilus (MSHA type) biogenesis protein MshL [Dechloromonas denitrificans]UCV04442.1 pilus (MSHA type) biogenesis protein MshL [Dechloromonas denitrificans]UCV08776.1 pilus (MSHA type) biogenesis protein MshL [Dechloromonas denitrificans]
MKIGFISATLFSLLLAACSAPTPREPLKGHLSDETAQPVASGTIPAPVQQSLALPKPRATPKAETYSVVVNNVPVRDLLFALARDAKVNVDIHPGITGTVSLNAIDQTLPQLLTRISKQVDMRFEIDGPNLAVMPDSPFLKHYKVDYVNMSRNVTGTVSTNTQIATGTATAGGSGTSPAGGSGSNVSSTRIENASKNQFWESLEKNIKDILRETDKVLPEGSSETVIEQTTTQSATGAAALPQGSGQRAALAIANALQANPTPGSNSQAVGNTVMHRNTFREAASVIMNAESGVITVRATQRQHDRIQEFVDRVINSARRQVLIEATIVEVELSDGYKQGIDWSRFRSDKSGFSITRPTSGAVADTANAAFNLVIQQMDKPLNLIAAVDLLQSFGTTKVLSSPRLSVLNNQTAMLKVVENIVYFSVKADTTITANVGTTTAVTTTPQSVSVGLVMAVTPQISDTQNVILNIRPTISAVSDWKEDPNPSNKIAGVQNFVPQIRTREIESVMRVASGDIAVLGGLMEDRIEYNTGRLPLLGQIPFAGELVTKRDNAAKKSELVIFLRPIVIKDASLDGDFAGMRGFLPAQGFFNQPNEAQPFNVVPSR